MGYFLDFFTFAILNKISSLENLTVKYLRLSFKVILNEQKVSKNTELQHLNKVLLRQYYL